MDSTTKESATEGSGRTAWKWLRALARGPAQLWRSLVAPRGRRRWGVPVFVLIVLAAAWVLLAPLVMVASYRFPELSEPVAAPAEQVAGVAYVDALLRIHDEGLRPWLPNDRLWPTVLLDNPQAHQLGQLEGMRYGVRMLRDHLSRQRSTDTLDPDVNLAHERFNIAADSWLFPPAERQYAEGAAALRRYRERLTRGEAHFYPRADNLVELLYQLNSLTGGANARLYNCVPDIEVRTSAELGDDPNLRGERRVASRVPWSEVDDQFYFAQGVALAYRELLVAIRTDFAQVLALRNADELLDGMIADFLDHSQFEPIYVANGRFGSLWANHPHQLLSLLSQVRERSRSLMTMLDVNVR
jgi:hypothetical protein